MEIKKLINALRDDSICDTSDMLDYMSEAADLLEEQQERISELEEEAKTREEVVVSLRKKWQEAETLLCTMCAYCEYEITESGTIIMSKKCSEVCGYPCCNKFVPRNRWIPVMERLPDLIPCGAGTGYSEAVNVLTDGRKVLTAVWNGTRFLCDADYWEAWGEKITHWTPVLLPLPDGPKEGE